MITEAAPAKINLYLHVGAVREDGLHDLASLFVFTEEGDRLFAEPAGEISLTIDGPFAAALSPFPVEDNLVFRAAARLAAHAGVKEGAALRLEKNLPVSAGIGGGSADAAAALRALRRLWRLDIDDAALAALAFDLGADIPACLGRAPQLVSGAGELLSAGPSLPPTFVCLVNPLVETPTGPVFRAFDAANPAPPAPVHPDFAGEEALGLALLLKSSRNDLEAPATALVPVVKFVLDFLSRRPGALGARMSGSGATCFALFADGEAAQSAARAGAAKGWWTMASALALA